MSSVINAVGLACPKPVILAKRSLESAIKVEILVDNDIAVRNLEKLARSLGKAFEVHQDGQNQRVLISTTGEDRGPLPSILSESVVMITTELFGEGDPKLGAILMRSFLYALAETEGYPGQLILINGGVRLIENTEALESLEKLNEQGTKILACGTCLDFFDLKDKFTIGEVTNMYEICTIMKEKPVSVI